MRRYPYLLFVLFAAVFTALGIAPVSRDVWYAEVIPVVLAAVFLAWSFTRFRLSNTAYTFCFFWLALHTIGAHYTFAEVPFGWAEPIFGSTRNHFDRMAHFTVGFYAFPLAEWLSRKRFMSPLLAGFFGLFFVMAVAAAYEIIEWQYAVIVGGENAEDFLGSQGDPWDAQKDMLCDTCGAIFSLAFFFLLHPWRLIVKREA